MDRMEGLYLHHLNIFSNKKMTVAVQEKKDIHKAKESK